MQEGPYVLRQLKAILIELSVLRKYPKNENYSNNGRNKFSQSIKNDADSKMIKALMFCEKMYPIHTLSVK